LKQSVATFAGHRATPDWRRSPEAAMDQLSKPSAIGVLFVVSFFAAFIAIVVHFG
jgi:hypothetical protein